MFESIVYRILELLALPKVGLSAVFVVSFVSATWLPMGSEFAVFAVVKENPSLFWPVMWVATLGNTLGGAFNYFLGYGAKQVFAKGKLPQWLVWMGRFGPKLLLLSWLPGVGDFLCSMAGWLRLPFWPCVLYMAIGKLARYIILTSGLLAIFNPVWAWISPYFRLFY